MTHLSEGNLWSAVNQGTSRKETLELSPNSDDILEE